MLSLDTKSNHASAHFISPNTPCRERLVGEAQRIVKKKSDGTISGPRVFFATPSSDLTALARAERKFRIQKDRQESDAARNPPYVVVG